MGSMGDGEFTGRQYVSPTEAVFGRTCRTDVNNF